MLGAIAFAAAALVFIACLGVLRHAGQEREGVRAALNSTCDGILVVSADRRVVTFNQRFIDLWRIRDCLRSSRDGDALLQYAAAQLRDPGAFLSKVRDLHRQPEARTDDVVESEDGRIYEWRSEPQRLRHRTIGRVWGFRDVTEVRRIQANLEVAKSAAESATRAKTEFLHNMSHEIRTPMNGVLGMLEITLDSDLNADQRECLGMAKMSGENLLAVVNDITDFSKIEAGKLEIDPAPFDVSEWIEKTAKSLALSAHQKGLSLICNIADSVPSCVLGDLVRLRQVLINLISNAVKFTEMGEVVIAVEGHSREPRLNSCNSLELQVSVRDSGIGIRPEHLQRIFEPFSQADASTTRLYGGTGLGLTISKRLVELMGGRIWVESEPGHGSAFRFAVPVGIDETLRPGATGDRTCFPGLHALVVDENATNRRVLVDYLSRCGWNAQSTDSGTAAAKIIASPCDSPRVVIADAQVPGIDRLTFAGGRPHRPELILMLTAARNPLELRRCRELGAAATLIKPIGEAELRGTVVRILGNRRTTRGRPAAPSPPSSSPAANTRTSHSLRILLAEDNPVNQKVALRLLQKDGHWVMPVNNGRDALAAFEGETFELILMDIEMPEMNGLEATAAIRSRERVSGGRTPIVAMTAHAMSGDRERCLAAGMDDYITKPIRRADLTRLIGSYIIEDERAAEASRIEVPV